MRAKPLFIALAAAAGLLAALALVAAFLPPVQTWAARKAVVALGGSGASIESASIGFRHVSLKGVRLELEGSELTLPSVEADMTVVPALVGKVYHVRSLEAKGWTLDLTRSRAADSVAEDRQYPWLARAFGSALAVFNLVRRRMFRSTGLSLKGRWSFPMSSADRWPGPTWRSWAAAWAGDATPTFCAAGGPRLMTRARRCPP